MHSSYAIVQTVWPILWPYRNQLLLPLVGMQSLITFFVLSWEFIQLHKIVPIYSISSAFFCHFSLSVASSKLLILFQFRLDFIIAPICKFHKRSMRQLCTKSMNQKLQQHNWDAKFFINRCPGIQVFSNNILSTLIWLCAIVHCAILMRISSICCLIQYSAITVSMQIALISILSRKLSVVYFRYRWFRSASEWIFGAGLIGRNLIASW